MENHVRLLGLLIIAVGALNGLIAIFQFVFFGGAVTISVYLGMNIGLVNVWLWSMLLLMLPSIVIGLALLGFRAWARSAGIVLSIFSLLCLPLGTILGLYGLGVLFSDSADVVFTPRYR